MNNINDFVSLLIKEKGLEQKDPEVVAQIRKDILESLEGAIDAMVISHIPEDELDAFGTVLDSDDQTVIATYIRKHIPDMDEKVATVLLTFKNSYLA